MRELRTLQRQKPGGSGYTLVAARDRQWLASCTTSVEVFGVQQLPSVLPNPTP